MFQKFSKIKNNLSERINNFRKDKEKIRSLNWIIFSSLFWIAVILILASMFETHDRKLTEKVLKSCPIEECKKIDIKGLIIPDAEINVKYDIKNLRFERINLKSVRLTAYNNHPNQTSSSPNTFASGRIVYEGGVAISQDILDKYQLKYGDLVYIPKMGAYFVYEDKMAYGRKAGERTIKNTIDIFMFSYEVARTFHHSNEEVIIYKLARNQ